MNRRCGAFVLAALGLVATGCEKAAKNPSKPPIANTAISGIGGRPKAALAMMSIPAYAADSPLPRFVAEHHHLEIVTPESELQKSWDSLVVFCGTIHCEVVSSSLTTRTGDSVPAGSVTLRVVREDLGKLLARLQTLGKIAQHTTEREDKTTAVVDTEAKIKNLTSFRDNLRAMLNKSSATVKDLVEIQQQLTETQAELDSETAQQKILANETEKIAVDISFRVETRGANAGGLRLVGNALRESGSVLADSTASLIYTIFSILPWLVFIVPGCWFLVGIWRRVRRRQTVSAVEPPAVAD